MSPESRSQRSKPAWKRRRCTGSWMRGTGVAVRVGEGLGAAEVGAGQIMMGTDYPFPWVTAPVDHVLKTPGLNDAEREAILGGTAAKLLKLDLPSTR